MSFGPLSLAGATFAIALLTLASCHAAIRVPPPDGEAPPRALWPWLIAIGTFAIICGASWLVVDRFSSSHPFWDQWEEAFGLHRSFASGSFTWSDLLAPHNEHRIAVTRIWATLMLAADGIWDNRHLAAANALVHALPAALLLGLYARKLRLVPLVALGLALIVPWALPLAWENVPCGFQSQFYFLMLFALLALWLTAHCESNTRGFWLGLACALLALFTLGSGVLCAGAILLSAGIEALRHRSLARSRTVLLAASLALTLLGLALRVEVEGHHVLQPHSLGELSEATLRFAGFPFREQEVMAFVVWAPALFWGIRLVRQKLAWSRDQRFLAAFGLFVFLHVVAIAWARGAAGPDPASRYYDILSLGIVVNTLAAIDLVRQRRAWQLILVILWGVGVGRGIGQRAVDSLETELPGVAARGREQQRRLRGYLQSGDPAYLQGGALLDLPYPDRESLRARLDDPFVRSILPARLRGPEVDAPTSGPLTSAGLAFLTGGGLCWALAGAMLWRRSRSTPAPLTQPGSTA